MMDKKDQEILRLTVKEGVSEGVAPLWEEIRKQQIDTALNKQDIDGSLGGQVAQGERLGDLEKETDKLKGKVQRILWILGGLGTAAWVVVKLILE